MLISLSVLWGGSFFFAAVAVAEVPPLSVAFVRVAGGALVLLMTLRIMGVPLPKEQNVWIAFFAMGLLNNAVPFSLIFWAQTELASGVASVLVAMTPIFTVIAAHFATEDEPMSIGKAVGVVLGFTGVVTLVGGAHSGGSLLAHIAILLAAACYAIASIFAKRFARMKLVPLVTATGQLTASTVILLPVVLLVDQPWSTGLPGLSVLLSLTGLVVLSTALAYFLYFRILSTAGATNLVLVTFLVPPSAILLGVLVLGEVLTGHQLAGMAIIGAGLVAIDGRAFNLLRHR